MNLYKVNWTENGLPRHVIGLAMSKADASAYVKSFDKAGEGESAMFHMGEVSELQPDVQLLSTDPFQLSGWVPEVKPTTAPEPEVEHKPVLAPPLAEGGTRSILSAGSAKAKHSDEEKPEDDRPHAKMTGTHGGTHTTTKKK